MSTNITYNQCKSFGAQVEWRAGAQVEPSPEAQARVQPEANQSNSGASWWKVLNPLTWLVSGLGAVSIGILKLAELITGLAGLLLNYAVQYSVVDMKENLDKAEAVNNAWRVIRDVANMGFIFVLLYAAITTIIGQGQDNQKLIVKIVVVAILINFSLFFTKVIIDISNLLAVTFYDAIAPGALSSTVDRGLSNSLMEPLKLQSISKVDIGIVGERLLIIGVMGTIVSLIAAFVFFAVAIMFIIRFVVLIFVLILSPIAFVSFVLPQTEQYRKQWWNALSGQAFFAPIYFMLTWIVIVVSRGLLTSTGGSMATALTGAVGTNGEIMPPDKSSMGILVNFIIMIALLIASLTIAKEWANKAGGAVGKLTSWATGAAGGATLGMAGRFGRGTFGRAGEAIGDNEKLKAAAAKGGMGGMAARLALATGRKTGGASFDMRGTGLGGTLDAGKAEGKGGFVEFRKKKAEGEAKFAASLGPSDKTLAKAEQAVKDAKTDGERKVAQESLDRLKGLSAKDAAQRRKDVDKEKTEAIEDNIDVVAEQGILEDIKETEDKLIKAKEEDNIAEYQKLAQHLSALNDSRKRIAVTAKNSRDRIEREYEARKAEIKETKGAGENRKQAFASSVEKSPWAKFQGYNYAAAAQIRKGKSNKDKLAEAAKALAEEDKTTEGTTPPAAPPASLTPPSASGPTPSP
ncbi:MAG: hypothetical protein AAB641_01380 [Patescibacteria group bacterium]